MNEKIIHKKTNNFLVPLIQDKNPYENNLQDGLDILSQSFIRCKQYVNAGYLQQRNRVLFITENDNDTLRVFENKLLQRHSRTAVLQKVNNSLALHRFWGFVSIVNHRMNTGEIKQVFSLPTSYNGFLLRVAGYGYSFHLDYTPTAGETGVFKYNNYYGSEIEFVHFAQQNLKFNWTMESPEPENWGSLNTESGSWEGLLGLISIDEADVTFGCAFSHGRLQIINPAQSISVDFLGFVTPPQKIITSFTSFLKPLDRMVWFLTVSSSIIFAFILFNVSKMEHLTLKTEFKNTWSNSFEAWCWCFGVLLGEYIVPEMQMKTEKFPSIRVLLCTWSIGCLILCQSYAGNLKAHLMKPLLGKSIDSLEAIAESGLDVYIVTEGEEEDKLLETSQKPALVKIWRDRYRMTYPLNLAQVYTGERVVIEWIVGIQGEVLKHYTHPGTGKPLLYMSPDPIFSRKWQSFAVNKMSPWAEQLDQTMLRAIELGLPQFWGLRVLRQQALDDAKVRGYSPIQWTEPANRPLNVQDIQGALVLYPAIIAMLLSAFVIEVVWKRN